MTSLVELGRALERLGFDVGEHPAFGGVAPVHSDNSHHYRPKKPSDKFGALDINWRGPGSERRKLAELAAALQGTGLDELFWPDNDPVGGHSGHMHAAETSRLRPNGGRLRAFLQGVGGAGGGGSVKAPSFPVPGVPAGRAPTYTVPDYPTTPLPIPAAVQAQFAERIASANRNLSEARIRRQREVPEIQASFQRFLKDVGRQSEEASAGVMDQASARNLAFQPGFVAPRLKEVREDASAATAEATAQKQRGLAALKASVEEAQRAKGDVRAANTRDRARYRSELDRLIGI